ncbi:MAG: DUF4878 domain-containing protein [Bacteroidales bacterium]|nr:DUF4878 domain-containing protein [Bacteroidales bacterium]
MKKLLSIGFVLVFSAFMFSCGGGSSDNPADVAKDFLTALAEQDYDTAKDLGTEETGQLISMIEGMAAMIPAEEAEAGKEDIKTLKMGEVTEDGDKATVKYSTDKEGEKTVDMEKVDGKWKVAMKKEM